MRGNNASVLRLWAYGGVYSPPLGGVKYEKLWDVEIPITEKVMKIKSEQEVEELALTHISQFEADDYENVTQYAFHTIGEKDGFIRGYTQAQQDFISQASEGFEEWKAHNLSCHESARIHDLCERSYQAAKLSQAKEIEELRKENNELKKQRDIALNDLSIEAREVDELKSENEKLKSILNEAVNILRDGCLVYDQFVPSGSSSFRSDAQWFIDSMTKYDEIMGEEK